MRMSVLGIVLVAVSMSGVAAAEKYKGPQYAQVVAQARKSGESDEQIYLDLLRDPAFARKLEDAHKVGFTDEEIFSHLTLKVFRPDLTPSTCESRYWAAHYLPPEDGNVCILRSPALKAEAERIVAAQQQQREIDAQRAEEERQIAQERYQIELQQAQQADAERRAALMRFSAGMMAPTRSGSFGESVSNGVGAYTGAPVPSYAPPLNPPIPMPSAPIRTVCSRNGRDVECVTQ